MAYAVSVVQLIMYSITFVIGIAEIGTSIRAMIVLKRYDDYVDKYLDNAWVYSIGGIAHGVILLIYLITFFAMYRRNSGFVQTKADLIMNCLLILAAIPVGWFSNMIAFGTMAPLLIIFITEWIYVGTRKVSGKWSMSLYNVCAAQKNGINGAMGFRAAQPEMGYAGQGGLHPSGPYAHMPSTNSSFAQPYQAVPNPGAAPPYQYSTPYGEPQRPAQWR